MTVIELPDEQAAALKAKAASQGLTLEEWLNTLIAPEDITEMEDQPGGLQAAADIILRHMRDIPREIMDTLPTDGAEQHDHYIYGWPKKPV